MTAQMPNPGAVIQIRSSPWKVISTKTKNNGFRIVKCRGISGITKGKEASFVCQLEPSLQLLDPGEL